MNTSDLSCPLCGAMRTDKEHAGSPGAYRRGCRCANCKAAWSAYSLEARQRRAARSPELNPSLAHGKVTTANNHGCKCELCREAARVYYREYYRVRNAVPASAVRK